MTGVETAELVQPDPSLDLLPGESRPHWMARREADQAANFYQRGWWDSRNALLDAMAAAGLTKAQREALWRLMDATRDDRTAIDRFRAEQYAWRRQWADEEDAREAARRKALREAAGGVS